MATTSLGTLVRHVQKLAEGHRVQEWTDRQLLDDFAAQHSESAFAALVSRHGPMVMRVCRRVLHHEQDAEDAFQATFLVLARNTGSIRKRDAVADWLHGVAYRSAMKAKRGAARRRNYEARLRELSPPKDDSPTWDDVQTVLDEEVQRLPRCFREAFVLCVLEGKSGPDAAIELGCKEGTVKSRVNRARRELRGRLARRGIKLAALLAGLSLAENAGQATLSRPLVQTIIHFGLLVAAGEPAAEVIPSHIAALAAGVTRAMFTTKVKIATAVLIAACACAGLLAHQALAARERPVGSPESQVRSQQPQPAAAQEAPQPAVDDKESVAYAGRVLGPDGAPVAGAKLYLTIAMGYLKEPSPSPEYATTGPDGRFKFTVPKVLFGDQWTVVAATAANYGAAWVQVPTGRKRDDLTLRLVNDNVPITGQIVDLEGKPVPGATLSVLQINAAAVEDLGPWLEAAKGKKGLTLDLEHKFLSRHTIALSPKATTDAQGRFRLTGIGRDRLVRAQLDGPTIASQPLCILTRPGKAIEVTYHEGKPEYGDPRIATTYYGADFRHVAAPCQPVVGLVRDKDTQKPLAGVTIRSHTQVINPGSSRGLAFVVRTTTDAEGRYRLTGMPKGKGYSIVAIPDRDQPYVAINQDVPDSPGLEPVTVDVELKRGVWIEGKITDKLTGKPLRGSVEYFSLYSNPNLSDYRGFDGTFLLGDFTVGAKEDGSYRVVGLPGPGLVGVYAHKDTYLRADQRDDEFEAKESSLSTSPYHISFTSNYSALARIDPAKGADSVQRDVTLDPGWTFTGTLLGPDGKPLEGARRYGTGEREDREKRPPEFTVQGFNPRRPRDIFFLHLEKELVGMVQPPMENGGSITVKMGRGAAVMGRLVDADGKPRAGVELEVWYQMKEERGFGRYLPGETKTDWEGRFRIGVLLPKYEYRLDDGKGQMLLGAGLHLGQTKDLGDVQIKQAKE
jgi:RNA polymerase sigma factor (sigma-70 family)